ncbi:hypothetical protein AAU61_03405 [Desulfocarbo indianensis]|nr:hypothetical protein AAU61_03405 [Desulfocarbo indianensis]
MKQPVLMRAEKERPELAAPAAARSHWIDFLKGAAILCILLNHTEMLTYQPYYLISFLYQPTGLVTNAEIFIFLSGILTGYVYLPVMQKSGCKASFMKAAKRSLQLYWFQLLALVLSLAVIWFFHGLAAPFPLPDNLAPFFADPWSSLGRYATFTMFPSFFDVLEIYIFFLLLTALLLPWLPSKPLLPWAVALALYLGGNLLNKLGFDSLVHPAGLFFNPFAWYLLFFIGVWLGVKKRDGSLAIPDSKAILCLAIGLGAFIFINYKLFPLLGRFSGEADPRPLFLLRGVSLADLGPTRLLTFLALALITHRLVRGGTLSLRNPAIRGFCYCGRFSLEVYALGLVLTHLNYGLYHLLGGGGWVLVPLELGSAALSMALAFYLARRKSLPPSGY